MYSNLEKILYNIQPFIAKNLHHNKDKKKPAQPRKKLTDLLRRRKRSNSEGEESSGGEDESDLSLSSDGEGEDSEDGGRRRRGRGSGEDGESEEGEEDSLSKSDDDEYFLSDSEVIEILLGTYFSATESLFSNSAVLSEMLSSGA